MCLGDIFMISWKSHSKRQKIQVVILYVIWGLFGLIVTLLYISNVISTVWYAYGILAWSLLAAAFAAVMWFILRKRVINRKMP
jgi:hypothetical protein